MKGKEKIHISLDGEFNFYNLCNLKIMLDE